MRLEGQGDAIEIVLLSLEKKEAFLDKVWSIIFDFTGLLIFLNLYLK